MGGRRSYSFIQIFFGVSIEGTFYILGKELILLMTQPSDENKSYMRLFYQNLKMMKVYEINKDFIVV